MHRFRAVPLVGAVDKGFLASRPIGIEMDRDVAAALTYLNLVWRYEALFLREVHRHKDGGVVYKGALIDFYLEELEIFIEVRQGGREIVRLPGGKEPRKHKQERLAWEYGYGFAIVVWVADPVQLRQETLGAVQRAIVFKERARQDNPEWWKRRQLQLSDHRYLIVPEPVPQVAEAV